MYQKTFSSLGKSLVYCYTFQINCTPSSILDRSLYITAALWIMPEQTHQPAKEMLAAEWRLQCFACAQPGRCKKFSNVPPPSEWFTILEKESKAWAAIRPAGLLWDGWCLWECAVCSKRQVLCCLESVNILNSWKHRKQEHTDGKCSMLYLYGSIQFSFQRSLKVQVILK